MQTRKLFLAAAVLGSTSAHAQFDSMMNPMSMMMPIAMMGAPMMMGGMMNPGMMMNPMTMMMPMTMMGAPMMMGSMGRPQHYMTNPYLNPMGAANPYLTSQQPQSFFPMLQAAPAANYGAPAYGYYPQPAAPQTAPAGTWDPSAWMQMFSAPAQPAPQK